MAEFYTKHLEIENINDLEEYIFPRLRKMYPNYFDYYLLNTEGNEMVASVNGIPFSIYYERGKRLSLAVRIEYREKGEKLLSNIKRIVSPVMWYIDPSIKKERIFTSPIVSYEADGCLFNEWELSDPVGKLKNIALEYACGEEFENLEILYPGYTLEDLQKLLKYGEYIEFLPDNEIEEVNNLKELEVFYYIDRLCMKLDNIPKDIDSPKLRLEEEKTYFVLAYLIQRTKEFGVKVEKPSLEFTDPGVEFEAWMRWWREGIASLTDEEMEKYRINDEEFDTSFRPSGDFHSLIGEVIEERKIIAEIESGSNLDAGKE